MRKHSVASLLAASIIAAPAVASETVNAHYIGQGIHVRDAFECPGQMPCDPLLVTWVASFDFLVDSASDGTHAVTSVSLDSNLDAFSNQPLSDAPFGPLQLTITGGLMTDVEGRVVNPGDSTITFSGQSVSLDQAAQHHSGPTHAVALLVPEPSTLALMALGLGALPWLANRRRIAPSATTSS